MPNFTEGEWKVIEHGNNSLDRESGNIEVSYSYEIQIGGKPWESVAHFVDNESDARLMAQSKKMYGVLKEILAIATNPGVGPWAKAEYILSEIDKE